MVRVELPPTEAEQAVNDVRVGLAVADRVCDAASYGTEELNRVGDLAVTRRLHDWEDTEGITGWQVHFPAADSGWRYMSVSQSCHHGGSGWFLPRYDGDGLRA